MRIILLLVFLKFNAVGQVFQMTDILNNNNYNIYNRVVEKGTGNFISFKAGKGEGLFWLPSKKFKTGTIEVRMRGKDVFQQSFVGIAFHGQNDSTYEAVYCRPFNFFASDPIRKIHAVQYIYHPEYTWKKLRSEQNGIYENGLINPPDPNGWFVMKVIITKKEVKVLINDDPEPSLYCQRLSKSQTGKVGIFLGDGSGGDFEYIKIKK